MTLTHAQNFDQLNDDAKALIVYLMSRPNFVWPDSYMIEVRLDNPVHNILFNDDEGKLHRHAGGGSRHYAKHYGDDDWAVIHIEDPEWNELDHAALMERGAEIVDAMMEAREAVL